MAGFFFQGMPASDSLSRTEVNGSEEAQSRWVGVFVGLLIAIILVLFCSYAELIPMPDLAALLIVIGFEVMLKEGKELAEVRKVSRLNTVVAIITILVGVFEDLENAKAAEHLGTKNIFFADDHLFASTEKVLEAAQAWIDAQ